MAQEQGESNTVNNVHSVCSRSKMEYPVETSFPLGHKKGPENEN